MTHIIEYRLYCIVFILVTFRDKIVVVGHINTARRSKAFFLSGTKWTPLPDLKHHRNGAACAVYQVTPGR